ncbi:MAG TPA: hypothetical protein VFQ07_14075 [Candidatus Polarisedimenticolia bacterium]|nr:hypothetical protein [Candidatus Polarisedimenticolia bacterium]
MKSRERESLLEETLTAWRPRTPDGRILAHPAWADLPETERARAFDETLLARALESLLHPRSLSTTARAVLGRIGFPDEGRSS